MGNDNFAVERKGAVEVLTFTRPPVLNALNFQLLGQLRDHLLACQADPEVRVLIFTGQGPKAFCAGADIPELRGRHVMAERQGLRLGQEVFSLLESLGKPSIAAINGFALGGGLELALACTFRLATPNARLGLPELNLGLLPGYGGTQRLPRLVGQARALEMILLGTMVPADQAAEMGLVQRVVEPEELLPQSLALAEKLMAKSPLTIGLALEAVHRGLDMTLAEGLALEADLATIAYRTEDALEGLAAFVEKRPPNFRGK
ncbi:MAG: enoyl-CoA hydratase-related protein [Thermodesulfobacteriota bacterium]